MEKDQLPRYMPMEQEVMNMPKRPITDRKHVILTSWASVATALLIMVLIGGAFYVADLKSAECLDNSQATHSTKDYSRIFTHNGEETRQDFHLDEDDQTELIIKKSADGNIELITATDFKRKMSATYVPSTDQCMLLAGVDMDWMADCDEEEKTKKVDVLNDDEEDFKVSGNKVTDLSILPNGIKPYCLGKPTYWLQPDGTDSTETMEGAGRQKRGTFCTYIRVRKCNGNFCYYVNVRKCW